MGIYTLAERKILALSQLRLGPNKTWLYGSVQPLLDALKLIKKKNSLNRKFFLILVYFFCCFIFIISIFLWLSVPFKRWASSKSLVVFWVLTIIRLSRFTILILGWNSAGKYSLLGRVRRICQTIRLEINLTIIIFRYFLLLRSLRLVLSNVKIFYLNIIFYLLTFFIIILIETHRAPFDISEGEREIVSGYNTEFRSILFILIFLSEYSNLIFLRIFIRFMLLYKHILFFSLIMLLVLIVRTCFPRLRYDLIINYSWLKILPCVIFMSIIRLSNKTHI